MKNSKSVAIVGGGPSGLMAAEILARNGWVVTVYDAMPTVGRKFLLAGAHGGLNLTHSEPLDSFVARYGEASSFIEPALRRFTPKDLRDWADGLGQKTFIGSSGRVFPVEMHSKALLRAWLRRLSDLGVKFALNHAWKGWDKAGNLLFDTPDNDDFAVSADAVMLALGGASWPRTGSNGSWVGIMEAAGICVTVLRPANCGFVTAWSSHISHRFAGHPLKPVVVSFGNVMTQGEIMITAQGIEGSVIYALSGLIRNRIDVAGYATLSLDLRPGLPLDGLILRLRAPRKAQSFSTYLRKTGGLSPLAIALLRETTPPEKLPVNDVEALARLIKNVPLTLSAPASLDRAISTAGGVKFDEMNEDYMLLKRPGVFLAGEMMDWEAPTGGYLLQGCFSTAVSAARGILKFLEK